MEVDLPPRNFDASASRMVIGSQMKRKDLM